jgi:hypothetical protein
MMHAKYDSAVQRNMLRGSRNTASAREPESVRPRSHNYIHTTLPSHSAVNRRHSHDISNAAASKHRDACCWQLYHSLCGGSTYEVVVRSSGTAFSCCAQQRCRHSAAGRAQPSTAQPSHSVVNMCPGRVELEGRQPFVKFVMQLWYCKRCVDKHGSAAAHSRLGQHASQLLLGSSAQSSCTSPKCRLVRTVVRSTCCGVLPCI